MSSLFSFLYDKAHLVITAELNVFPRSVSSLYFHCNGILYWYSGRRGQSNYGAILSRMASVLVSSDLCLNPILEIRFGEISSAAEQISEEHFVLCGSSHVLWAQTQWQHQHFIFSFVLWVLWVNHIFIETKIIKYIMLNLQYMDRLWID